MSKFLYVEYPSGEERQFLINDWVMMQNFRSVTGEYPMDFWFSPGYEPAKDLVSFLYSVCHKVPAHE